VYAPDDAHRRPGADAGSLADLRRRCFTEGRAELREQATPALPLTGLLALTAVFVGADRGGVDLSRSPGARRPWPGSGCSASTACPSHRHRASGCRDRAPPGDVPC
jgi:hypothetical protein